MITSENVVFEARFMIFFISWKNHFLLFRYSICYILNNFINFESCDVIMSTSSRDGVYFGSYILWIVIYLVMKRGWLIDTLMGNIFTKYFGWLGGLSPKSSPFLIYQPTAINQKAITASLLFSTLLNMRSETIEK